MIVLSEKEKEASRQMFLSLAEMSGCKTNHGGGYIHDTLEIRLGLASCVGALTIKLMGMKERGGISDEKIHQVFATILTYLRQATDEEIDQLEKDYNAACEKAQFRRN